MRTAHDVQSGLLKAKTLDRELAIIARDKVRFEERNRQLVRESLEAVNAFNEQIGASGLKKSRDRLNDAKRRFGDMVTSQYPQWAEAAANPIEFQRNIYARALETAKSKKAEEEYALRSQLTAHQELSRHRDEYMDFLKTNHVLTLERERMTAQALADQQLYNSSMISLQREQVRQVQSLNLNEMDRKAMLDRMTNSVSPIQHERLDDSRPFTAGSMLPQITEEGRVTTPVVRVPQELQIKREERPQAPQAREMREERDIQETREEPIVAELKVQQTVFPVQAPPVIYPREFPPAETVPSIPQDRERPKNVLPVEVPKAVPVEAPKPIPVTVEKPQPRPEPSFVVTPQSFPAPPVAKTAEVYKEEDILTSGEFDDSAFASIAARSAPPRKLGGDPPRNRSESVFKPEPAPKKSTNPAPGSLVFSPYPTSDQPKVTEPKSDSGSIPPKLDLQTQLKPKEMKPGMGKIEKMITIPLEESEEDFSVDVISSERNPAPDKQNPASLNLFSGIPVVEVGKAITRQGKVQGKEEVKGSQTRPPQPKEEAKSQSARPLAPKEEVKSRSQPRPEPAIPIIQPREEVKTPDPRALKANAGKFTPDENVITIEPSDDEHIEIVAKPRDHQPSASREGKATTPSPMFSPESTQGIRLASPMSSTSSLPLDRPLLQPLTTEVGKLKPNDRIRVLGELIRKTGDLFTKTKVKMNPQAGPVTGARLDEIVKGVLINRPVSVRTVEEYVNSVIVLGYDLPYPFFPIEILKRKKGFSEQECVESMTGEAQSVYNSLKEFFQDAIRNAWLTKEMGVHLFTNTLLNYKTSKTQFSRAQTFVTNSLDNRGRLNTSDLNSSFGEDRSGNKRSEARSSSPNRVDLRAPSPTDNRTFKSVKQALSVSSVSQKSGIDSFEEVVQDTD